VKIKPKRASVIDGPATKKLSALIGENNARFALQLYADVKAMLEKDRASYLVDNLKDVHKGLETLRKAKLLTKEGELAVYTTIVDSLQIYDKAGILWDLFVRFRSKKKPGPQPDHAFDILVAYVASLCKKVSPKRYWPVVIDFIIEQKIRDEDSSSPEQVKVLLQRRRRQYGGHDVPQDNLFWLVYSLRTGDEMAGDVLRQLLFPEQLRTYLSTLRER
jgi:hypothetical protein